MGVRWEYRMERLFFLVFTNKYPVKGWKDYIFENMGVVVMVFVDVRVGLV